METSLKKEPVKKSAPKPTVVKKTEPKATEQRSPVKHVSKKTTSEKTTTPKKKMVAQIPKPKVSKPMIPTPTSTVRARPELVRKTRRLSRHKPKLVFVIDDMGHTPKYRDRLMKLGNHVTYAILPMLPYSQAYSQLSKKTGAEVILHLPLESSKGTIPGPGLITERMTDSHILDVLGRNLRSVPHHVGVNNHMGSLGTSDSQLMTVILKELKRRGLFFFDSYTTTQTVGFRIGGRIGLPVLKRDVFLDNKDDQTAVREQVRKLAALARKKGFAIGIGHYRYNTLKVFEKEIPRLIREGFEIISLSDLIRFQSNK